MKLELISDKPYIITSASNLYYFSQYKNEDCIILWFENKAYYFTDSRYFEDVNACLKDFIIKDIIDFYKFLENNYIKTLGIEDSLPFYFIEKLKSINCESFYSVSEKINELRSIKSAEELWKIKKAQAITDLSFLEILHYIKPGITEKNLSNILYAIMYQNGADDKAFDNIVAFGENTSKPHAQPSEKVLEYGMPVLFDFGAKWGNYCSDMTRTVFYGQPTQTMINIYDTVLGAQKTALNKIKCGMTGKECDSTAREFFKLRNLDKYFIHSLGHSLGIDIHEKPNFSQRCNSIMKENIVMSVEPGLYFENSFGIRIEDIIYFDKEGIINLTKSEKNIIIIE